MSVVMKGLSRCHEALWTVFFKLPLDNFTAKQKSVTWLTVLRQLDKYVFMLADSCSNNPLCIFMSVVIEGLVGCHEALWIPILKQISKSFFYVTWHRCYVNLTSKVENAFMTAHPCLNNSLCRFMSGVMKGLCGCHEHFS